MQGAAAAAPLSLLPGAIPASDMLAASLCPADAVALRTAYALQFLKGTFETAAIRSASLPFGSGGEVRPGRQCKPLPLRPLPKGQCIPEGLLLHAYVGTRMRRHSRKEPGSKE